MTRIIRQNKIIKIITETGNIVCIIIIRKRPLFDILSITINLQ